MWRLSFPHPDLYAAINDRLGLHAVVNMGSGVITLHRRRGPTLYSTLEDYENAEGLDMAGFLIQLDRANPRRGY